MLESDCREFVCVYIIYNFYKAKGVIVSSEAFKKSSRLSFPSSVSDIGHPVLRSGALGK